MHFRSATLPVALSLALSTLGCAAHSSAPGAQALASHAPSAPRADASDRAAIHELLERLSDSLNHHDWTAAGALLTEDAVWEALPPIGWKLEGRAAIVGFLSKNGSKVEVLNYDLFAIAIDLETPTRARARSSMDELLRLKETETGLRIGGTYSDSFVKDARGEWRVRRRSFRLRYEDDVALPERLHGAGGSNAPGALQAK